MPRRAEAEAVSETNRAAATIRIRFMSFSPPDRRIAICATSSRAKLGSDAIAIFSRCPEQAAYPGLVSGIPTLEEYPDEYEIVCWRGPGGPAFGFCCAC